MDTTNSIKFVKLVILIILVICLLPIVYGFGVTTPYWDTNPLVMAPGQTVEFNLLLQNMIGNEDIKARAKVVSGHQFIQITDNITEYFVPFGKSDVKINLKVSVPLNATDVNYTLGILVETIPPSSSSVVQLGSGIKQTIPLVILGGSPQPKPLDLTPPAKKEEREFNKTYLLVLIIIVLIIIAMLWYKKRGSSDEQ
ncbi:hypothetical protein HYU23_01085 [Candidatus Woesearchaeota archaeon]|nr:hypothetical protein [Candidatus Woesearchaeota archaeon]